MRSSRWTEKPPRTVSRAGAAATGRGGTGRGAGCACEINVAPDRAIAGRMNMT